MDKREEKALKDIDEYGCHILHVMGDEENPRFSYSIGIFKRTRHPEIIVTGVKQELANWLINEYNERIKAGETFDSNVFYKDFLENFDVTFKEVELKHYSEYFGWGNWYYKGNDFKALQLIYPSTNGIWPWDSKAKDEFTWFIPKLYAN